MEEKRSGEGERRAMTNVIVKKGRLRKEDVRMWKFF